MDNIELRLGCLSAGDGLKIFRRLNQCASAGDGLAPNRLAMAKNGGGLQVYCIPYRRALSGGRCRGSSATSFQFIFITDCQPHPTVYRQ